MPYLLEEGGLVTRDRCALMASAAGYRIFALQAGGQCWGGNDEAYAKSWGSYGAACVNTCQGDGGQICGAGYTNSLYRLL